MEIILAIVFNNVKISGKMKIICFDFIATWLFHIDILARLLIECTHYM